MFYEEGALPPIARSKGGKKLKERLRDDDESVASSVGVGSDYWSHSAHGTPSRSNTPEFGSAGWMEYLSQQNDETNRRLRQVEAIARLAEEQIPNIREMAISAGKATGSGSMPKPPAKSLDYEKMARESIDFDALRRGDTAVVDAMQVIAKVKKGKNEI